jgi:signal peptidase II
MLYYFNTERDKEQMNMLFYIIIMVAVAAFDQLTKLYAVYSLAKVTTVPIIPNVFHLTYVENTGAAFSTFSGQQTFLIVITIIFILALGYLFAVLPKDRRYFNVNLALAFIIGGALGNLIDRIRLNYVVDFFDFRVIGFAIFNVADSFVVIGCIIMVIAIWQNRFPQKKEEFRTILPPGAQRARRAAPETAPTAAAPRKAAPAVKQTAVRPPSKTAPRPRTAPAAGKTADTRQPVRFAPSKPMEAPKTNKPHKDSQS